MASFAGKPLPDFKVSVLSNGNPGKKASLKAIAAGRPLVGNTASDQKNVRRLRMLRAPGSDPRSDPEKDRPSPRRPQRIHARR